MARYERTILHVDDDEELTRLVGKLLSHHGFQTTCLHDPAGVIEQLGRHGYRVVLLDIDMPSINGLELLRQIKQYDGGIQVVMLTGISTVSTILTAMRWGAEACFFKPIDEIGPLVEALEDVFAKIDRWWGSLHDLTRRRHSECSTTAV